MSKRRPDGDGMVRKREDGRWEGRIVIGHKEKVVSDETVDEVGLKFAKKMSKAAPIAARAFKECVRRATLPNYEELRKEEEAVAEMIYQTEDCKRGLTSLAENENGPMCEFLGQ